MHARSGRDVSYGIIPLSQVKGRWEVFLILHARARHWGFPKGHAEPDETPQEAALRELKEETNLEGQALLREEPFVESYSFIFKGKRVFKTVSYFAAEVKGSVRLQNEEIEDGVWLPIDQAFDRLTHREGKAILGQVASFLEGKR